MPLQETAIPQTPQEQLQVRLADPRTVDSLNRLLDHLDTISASVEMLDSFIRRSSEVVDNVSDSVAELRSHDTGETLKVVENLPKLARVGTKMVEVADSPAVDRLLRSGLLERLSEPRTIEALTLLLDKLELISFAVTAIDGFLRRGDELADSAAESMNDLRKLASSIPMDDIRGVARELPQLTAAGHQLVASGVLSKVSELTEAGMLLSNEGFFDPKTVRALAEMGRVAADSYEQAKMTPPRQYSLFDLMRLLKDPAVQRSVHIMVQTTKQFGQQMMK